MAHAQMARERNGGTLQTTDLVHEAHLRLVGQNGQWANRRHYFAAAAEAMRRILVEYARKREAEKRGGGKPTLPLEFDPACEPTNSVELLDVHEALDSFEAQYPDLAELVKLRYFVGLTVEETAEMLGVSKRKVNLDWKFARTWLHRKLSEDGQPHCI
jgi:RNA polymerase sigma factor (TIGR02999 family)